MNYEIESNNDIFNIFEDNYNDREKLELLSSDINHIIEFLKTRKKYEEVIKENDELLKVDELIEIYQISKIYIEYRILDLLNTKNEIEEIEEELEEDFFDYSKMKWCANSVIYSVFYTAIFPIILIINILTGIYDAIELSFSFSYIHNIKRIKTAFHQVKKIL